jgi:hypothetical protein
VKNYHRVGKITYDDTPSSHGTGSGTACDCARRVPERRAAGGQDNFGAATNQHWRARAYYTLDTLETLQAAQADPQGFVDNLPLGAVVDEVQRAPELLLPLKRRIDAERQAGMFLLTGSAEPAHATAAWRMRWWGAWRL